MKKSNCILHCLLQFYFFYRIRTRFILIILKLCGTFQLFCFITQFIKWKGLKSFFKGKKRLRKALNDCLNLLQFSLQMICTCLRLRRGAIISITTFPMTPEKPRSLRQKTWPEYVSSTVVSKINKSLIFKRKFEFEFSCKTSILKFF